MSSKTALTAEGRGREKAMNDKTMRVEKAFALE